MATQQQQQQQQNLTWPASHDPIDNNSTQSENEECLDLISLNDLRQGELYIIKIKLITIALFQGWHDEMCCFYVLRTDLSDMSRWCEARYLPNNFDAYYAFDHAGNPPIHLWTKQLKTAIPYNWFSIFEEAKRMQRWWIQSYLESDAMLNYYEKSPSSYEYSITTTDYNSRLNGSKEDEGCEDVYEDKTLQQESTVAPVSSNVIPFPDAIEIQHDHMKYHTSLPRTSSLPSNRQDETLKNHNMPQNTVTDNEESVKPERKKLTNRKSWSSLFLKKEKSKKAQNESKRNVSREARHTLPAYATSREMQYADNIDFN